MDEVVADRYRIEGELGRGGFATVYRAHDLQLDRKVALKVMAAAISHDPAFVARFEREARLAARLDHRNIVTVFDIGTMSDGRPFISMRLLDGLALERILEREGHMEPGRAIAILAQVAEALDYTHRAGFIHRDVKPANIMLDANGHATLTDFGIAHALDAMRVTMTGVSIGTPRYMAPEQITGSNPTAAADIYALGCTAFEMLAGRPPFEGSGTSLLYRVVHEPAPSLMEMRPDLGEAAATVLGRALAKDPAERWQSAGLFVAMLAGALRIDDAVAPPPPDPSPLIAPTELAPVRVETPARPAATPPARAATPPPARPATTPPLRPSAPASEATATAATGGGGSNAALIGAIGGGALLVLLAVGAFFLFGRGGDDDEGALADGAATVVYTATPTSGGATGAGGAATPTPPGGWAEITGITQNVTAYQVTFRTGGFTYSGRGSQGDEHVHFYWNTTPREQAGVPGAGPWHVYYGPSPVLLPAPFTVADRPAGATQLCILVATADHGVKANTGGNCYPLPR